jgi:tetratricopeptide (TPR) repeat protein
MERMSHALDKHGRLIRRLHLTLLILITSIVFSNTLDNTYHLDSIYRIQNNTEINKFWPPSRFFTDVRTGSSIPQIAEYRPMMPLSHSINSEIAAATGTSKLVGFHVGNIAIHIGSTILVYFLCCLLISNWGKIPKSEIQPTHYSHQAFAAALIFAVHPIAGSAVNYLAARDLLLMVFFFLASMLVYFGMRRTGDTLLGWMASLLLLSLAILSKQAAIMGFGLIFLFEWILVDLKLRSWGLWTRTALYGLPTVAYFTLRALWLAPQNFEGLRAIKGLTYPLTMLDAHLFYYLRNFVWPFEMRALARVEMIESILAPSALIGLVFIVATLSVAWILRKRQPLVTFAILAYWLLFSLTSSIFPFGYVVTDYRQYLPSVFLCLVVTLACFSIKPRILPVALLVSMGLYFSYSSYLINKHWQTEESFWGQSVKYEATALAHQNYGLAVVDKDESLAEYHFREAIRQYPYHIYANINLAMLEIRQKKNEQGLQRLRRMVDLNPKWALPYYWLSMGLRSTGDKAGYVEYMVQAADLDPRSLRYQYAAGQALHSSGKRAESIPYFERIMGINPEYELTGFWLGFAYQKTNQPQQAIDTYKRFLGHNSDHVQARFNLAYELMKQNDCELAIIQFDRVLALRPGYREVHTYLSRCYRALGDEVAAARHNSLYQSKK